MAKKKSFEFELPFGKVSLTQLALFARGLAVMLNSGVPITEGLKISEESVSGKFRKILMEVRESVESGRSLSSSLAEHRETFSPLFVNTVEVGESSGTLSENMVVLAEQLNKRRELVSKVKGVMIYPAVLLTAVLGLGVFVSVYILPKVTPMFKQLRIELPLTTRMLIWFAGVMDNYGIFVIVGLLGLGMLIPIVLQLPAVKPITHWLLIRLPGVSQIVRGASIVIFCRTMGTLLKSGVSIDESMNITKDTMSNYYFRKALGKVEKNIVQGTNLSDNLVLFPGLFPKMVIKMVKVGEESGKLDETLLYLAEFYEQEVDTATKALPALIEPLLLLFMGLIVGFLALSIMTPIFKISGGIRR